MGMPKMMMIQTLGGKRNTNENKTNRVARDCRLSHGRFFHYWMAGLWLLLLFTTTTTTTQALSTTTNRSHRCRLGLLTFDLDDTLFPTTAVVDAANAAMLQRLAQHYDCVTDMPRFQATTRQIRHDTAPAPLIYTELRKRAIAATFLQDKGESPTAESVDDCFQVWLDARNAAADEYLFPSVTNALQQIKTTHRACIAAVTNGRGDPLDIPSLAPYFDFTVSGEDDDVFPQRKPHKGIYEKTLRLYRDNYPNHGDEHAWVHVGDCLANDVGASAACGALAVWAAPPRSTEKDGGEELAWSTATASEVAKRKALAVSAASNVAARISSLEELPGVILRLLQASNDITGSVSATTTTSASLLDGVIKKKGRPSSRLNALRDDGEDHVNGKAPLTHKDILWKIRCHPEQPWTARVYFRLAALALHTYLKLTKRKVPSVLCPAGGLCQLEAWYEGKRVGRFGITTTSGPPTPVIADQVQQLYPQQRLPGILQTAAIQFMVVEPAYRKRQIGRLALQVIAHIHASQNCDFTLLVADENGSGRLLAWYERYGFRQAPMLQDLLGSPNQQYGVAMIGPTKSELPEDCRLQWW